MKQLLARAALAEIAAGAGLETRRACIASACAGEHEYLRVRVLRHDPPDRLEPADAGHREIHDDDVGRDLG
jgi:hypothetical protein